MAPQDGGFRGLFKPTLRGAASAQPESESGFNIVIEPLMKEDRGRDHLGLAWQMPGEPPPENLSPPIPGMFLAVPPEWTKKSSAALMSRYKDSGQP
jgi:hypothetical protein